MKSKMFLNNVTVIDCAYIDNKGMIIGDSVTPKFVIAGEIDEDENVVVDFSTIKKDIKDIIDARYSGFDHKVWVIEGYSNYWLGADKNHLGNLVVETPHLRLDAPKDAFKFVRDICGEDYIGSVMHQMVAEIEDELNLRHPKTKIKVTLDFNDEFIGSPSLDVPMVPFRYVHGLKCSSSWGCQNIAHGHLSYLSATVDRQSNMREVEMLLHNIAQDLDKMIFIWAENIVALTEDFCTVQYATKRGMFVMEIERSYSDSHVLILETETTVELLASAIAKEYKKELTKAGVLELFVSEGLNKGAVIDIQGE